MTQKKILFISHDAGLHGATRSMLDIAEQIQKNYKYQTTVILPKNGPATKLLIDKQVHFEILKFSQLFYYNNRGKISTQGKNIIKAFLNLPILIRYCKKYKPDFIYINTIGNYWLLHLKFFVKAKVIFHIREFGKPDHNIHLYFKDLIFNLLKKLPDICITNSYSVHDYFLKKYKIDSKVIYNGVMTKARFEENLFKRNSVNQENKRFCIGIIGHLGPNKGQMQVLQAVHQIHNAKYEVRLFIIGGGSERKKLEAYIEQNHLQNIITITGLVNNVDEYYSKLDLVVANSSKEAFGRVVVEASSFGIPVIAKNTGAMPEIIIDGRTGFLHNGSIEDIQDKILNVLNRKQNKMLGMAGWQHCYNNFNQEKFMNNFIELINNIS